MSYSIGTLAEILAQIAHFSTDDSEEDGPVSAIAYNTAMICACFLAQHTDDGIDGVEIETAFDLLRCNEAMPYEERLELAKKAVAEFGGEK